MTSRTHDAKRPRPGSSSGLTGSHSVCWWNGISPNGFGRSVRSGGVIWCGRGTSGTGTSWNARCVSCARPNTPCTRNAGPAPGTWTSAATCDALRPSRSTSTSISTGPGGTGARKIALAVTSGSSGRAERFLHGTQRGVHADAAEHVHHAPAVGDRGVIPTRDRRVRRQGRVGAEISGIGVSGAGHPVEPRLPS